MKLHEYQGKAILKKYGISLPQNILFTEKTNAWVAAIDMGLPVVLKAQVLAGGRGKAGGIKFCKTEQEVKDGLDKMFGLKLATKQTAGEGLTVKKVMIEKGIDIDRELYVSIMLNRETSRPMFILSASGGMDIEELSENEPEKIVKIDMDPMVGFMPFHARTIAQALNLEHITKKVYDVFNKLYNVFMGEECMMLEVNPLVLTKDEELIPVDIKMDIDDNALSRRKDLADLRDLSEENPDEMEAKAFNLNLVKLEGNIGCMVNGAGLAMATMDTIKLAGGEPANFMDVGGGATAETIAKGFEILTHDDNVKAIFVNIFGGIVRCDRVASGIVSATKLIDLTVPLIIRLTGSNKEEGMKILKDSGLDFKLAEDVKDAIGIIQEFVKN